MLPNGEIDWSNSYHPIPKTEQGFINLREWARKKAIEMSVKRYFDGMKGARNMRYFWNDGKKNISGKEYQALVTSKKVELGKTLSGLLRKGDKITVPSPG